MIRNLKHIFLRIPCLGLCVCLFACNPEKENPIELIELKAPSIRLEISGDVEKLHNEVTLSVKAIGDEPIEGVDFFLNEQLLGQATEAPYELRWDTKEVEDGRYMLKAIASNASGEDQVVQELKVKNTLLIVHIDDRFYQPRGGEVLDSWIFLSDKNGNTIGQPQQVADGARLIWQRPSDFHSDTIYFNRLDYNAFTRDIFSTKNKNLIVSTYPNLALEEIFLNGYFRYPQEQAIIGGVDITVNNDFDGTKNYTYATSQNTLRGLKHSAEPLVQYPCKMYEESIKAISTYEASWLPEKMNDRQKYYRLDELELGKAYQFHTNEYTPMEAKTIQIPFEYHSMMAFTTGYFKKDDPSGFQIDDLVFYDDHPNELKMFYADKFSIQSTFFYGSFENKNFNTFMLDKAPEVLIIPELSARVSRDENNIVQVLTQSTFDIGNASWQHIINNENEHYTIRKSLFFSNESGLSYAMPQIPADLLEMYPHLSHPLKYRSVYMNDHKALTTYEEMLKYYFTPASADIDHAPYFALTIYAEEENNGGRFLHNKKIEDPQAIMEAAKLRARGIFSY